MAVTQSAMRKVILIASSLLLVGCAGSTRVLGPTVGCSSLIPDAWRDETPTAVMEGEDWQVFAVEQTAALMIANTEREGILQVVGTCEARDQSAIRQTERPWWALW